MPPVTPQPIDQMFQCGPIKSIKVTVADRPAGKPATLPVSFDQVRFEQIKHLISGRPLKRYSTH